VTIIIYNSKDALARGARGCSKTRPGDWLYHVISIMGVALVVRRRDADRCMLWCVLNCHTSS